MNYDLTDDPISLDYKKKCCRKIQLTSKENLIKAYYCHKTSKRTIRNNPRFLRKGKIIKLSAKITKI